MSRQRISRIASVIAILFLSLTTNVGAHCRYGLHPHHCIEKAAREIYGAATKRAKIVWNDPVGAALSPWTVLDDTLPSPIELGRYLITNPEEIVEFAKNPVAGQIGVPLATAIVSGRNAALRRGTEVIPPHIREKLKPYYSERLLDSVRYVSDPGYFDGLAQVAALKIGGAKAVALVNVIVFRNPLDAEERHELWAHEMYHILQYENLGVLTFASRYTLDSQTYGGDKYRHGLEGPAYKFAELYSSLFASNTGSAHLIRGLGGKCMVSDASSGNTIRLRTCAASDRNQRWEMTKRGELRIKGNTLAGDRCLEIVGVVPINRTSLRATACNGSKAQKFEHSPRDEFRSAIDKRFCVETAGGITTDNNPIHMYECNQTESQEWVSTTSSLIAMKANGATGTQCLMAQGTVVGSLVGSATCSNTNPAMIWGLEGNSGQLRLLLYPDLCLQTLNNSLESQAPLELRVCNEQSRGQHFTMSERNARIELRLAKRDQRCIELNANRAAAVASCNGGGNQELKTAF
jgi:hypothetical protein